MLHSANTYPRKHPLKYRTRKTLILIQVLKTKSIHSLDMSAPHQTPERLSFVLEGKANQSLKQSSRTWTYYKVLVNLVMMIRLY